MATVENFIKAGAWRTVLSLWGSGAKVQGVFRLPAGMRIKVRYGFGWFGKDGQKQTLDGVMAKTLSVGGAGTYLRVRFQVRFSCDTNITWEHLVDGP